MEYATAPSSSRFLCRNPKATTTKRELRNEPFKRGLVTGNRRCHVGGMGGRNEPASEFEQRPSAGEPYACRAIELNTDSSRPLSLRRRAGSAQLEPDCVAP